MKTTAGSYLNCSPWASEITQKTTSKAPPGPLLDGLSISRFPTGAVGSFPTEFQFLPEDHDDGEKEFLGHKGNFNGEDIIDIIVKQPATARFISRHLYNFFVEDETQVPSWQTEPPKDETAIALLSRVFMETNGDMKAVLGELFNSEFFKNAINLRKVKSPAELVVGVLRQTGEFRSPRPGIHQFALSSVDGDLYEGTMAIMGQTLMNPPTVEGWHTGHEWIDSGTLSERIGFAARQFEDESKPGTKEIISRAGSLDDDPSKIVDRCLDLMGGLKVSETTYQSLVSYARELKEVADGTVGVHNLLQMLVSTVDYQFA